MISLKFHNLFDWAAVNFSNRLLPNHQGQNKRSLFHHLAPMHQTFTVPHCRTVCIIHHACVFMQCEAGLCLHLTLKFAPSRVFASGLILDQHCSGSENNSPLVLLWMRVVDFFKGTTEVLQREKKKKKAFKKPFVTCKKNLCFISRIKEMFRRDASLTQSFGDSLCCISHKTLINLWKTSAVWSDDALTLLSAQAIALIHLPFLQFAKSWLKTP